MNEWIPIDSGILAVIMTWAVRRDIKVLKERLKKDLGRMGKK